MKRRFTEEQIIGFLKQAEAGVAVKELCRKHGFSDASFYTWRAKYGGMNVSEAKAPARARGREREAEEVACRVVARCRGAQGGAGPKAVTPQAMREAVATMREKTPISERRACRLVGISRSVLTYQSKSDPGNVRLSARIGELAAERRRFGYRRIHALLRREGYAPTTSASIASTVRRAWPSNAGASVDAPCWSVSPCCCRRRRTRSGRWIS